MAELSKNLLIRASAGTGKTFSIATRFIWLFIVKEVSADSILALTFSRAAAQEIYTKILERLWLAAYSVGSTEEEREARAREERATILKMIFADHEPTREECERELNGHKLDSAEFAKALRKLVESQHLGTIATLDSFLLKFVRSYPLELGFQNNVSLLEEYQRNVAREESYSQILSKTTNRDKIANALAVISPKWKRTYRQRIASHYSDTWREFLRTYGIPSFERLKNIFEIPSDLKPFDDNGGEISKIDFTSIAEETLQKGKPNKGAIKQVLNAFNNLKEWIRNYNGEKAPLSTTLVEELFRCLRENGEIPLHLVFGTRELNLPNDVREAIKKDLYRADKLFLSKISEKTIKRLELLSLFEREYDSKMRRAGLLTFDDLSTVKNSVKEKFGLENLYYRFDSRFSHWAIDEFQDTSEAQWDVLRELIDAASNDDSKSVIVVGDLKQSIYGWRGGSKKPFLDLMSWPAITGIGEDGSTISFGGMRLGEILDKDVSYRYEKNTCDFLNKVFSRENLRPFLEENCSEALNDWLSENCWREHSPATDDEGNLKRGDYVKVVGSIVDVSGGVSALSFDDDDDGEENSGREDKTILQIAKPLVKEISQLWKTHEESKSRESVGVLVRTNSQGITVAKLLRKAGLPVVWEGKCGMRDSIVVELILALLSLSEHPEDSAAWGFINVSPLSKLLLTEFDFSLGVNGVSNQIAKMLSEEGLSRALTKILKPIREDLVLKNDGENLNYLSSLVRAAVKFEGVAKATDGIDAFKKYVDTHASRLLAGSSDFIRVLTIHRSKGLGMDHVFVPIAETTRSDFSSSAAPVKDEIKGEWIFSDVSAKTNEIHPLLKNAWNHRRDEATSENLHTYYVALTRSKKSLTIVLPILQSTSKSGEVELKNNGFSLILMNATWGIDVKGEDQIFEFGSSITCKASQKRVSILPCVEPIPFEESDEATNGEIKRIIPSAMTVKRGLGDGGSIFEDSSSSAQIGIDRHSELAQIEWLEVANNDFERELLKPSQSARVWREKAYEIFNGSTWESGVIDRVVIYSENGINKAIVSDFKITSSLNDEYLKARYENQLKSYQNAVSKLTGIDKANIKMQLLVESPDRSNQRVLQFYLI